MPKLDLVIEPSTLETHLQDTDLLVVDVCAPQNWKQSRLHREARDLDLGCQIP